MTVPFDADKGLVIVPAQVTGPSGIVLLRLALDTGATSTLINSGLLVALGYDPAASPERTEVTTGSGIEFVARVFVSKFETLGRVRNEFPVLAHTLPPSAGVDGVLGLDFLRRCILTVDFAEGSLSLEPQDPIDRRK